MGARESILSAADQIFGDVGFDAASTREIAELSGVNKALIHYHFENKEALLTSVLDDYYVRLDAAIRSAVEPEGSLRDRMHRLVRAYADFLSRNQRFCRIVQRESSGGRHAAQIYERMRPLFKLGQELVVAAYPHTSRGALAAEQLLISVYGMIITYFTYSDVIAPLLDADPLSKKNLATRERHILRVIDVLLAEIESEESVDA